LNGHIREPESFPTRQSDRTSADARVLRGVRKDSTGARTRKADARASSLMLMRPRAFRLASVLLSLCVLAAPAAGFVPKGQKNYKQGLQYEAAQQWEKAAEEFSLAVAAEPSNSEYQLHYRRAVFNASQAFMQQGGALMDRGDYLGAYNAFRRANAYDPANELAASMMDRAFKLQTSKEDDAKPEKRAPAPTAARLQPTAYTSTPGSFSHRDVRAQDDTVSPSRSEQLHAIQYGGDLEQFVKYLARQLKLNVVFDRDFPKRNINVDLQDVTAAQALDYIFLTQGLFFQKLSNRTIVVAEQVKRPQYQQLVLRTFYLYNVDPNDARQLITASIPPQAGRQPVITANKSTNSITIRDTPENVRLVGELLRSIDKERAEVVMDVNIYEVSREDLMQLGNQIGTSDSLANLGGIQKGLSVVGGSRQVVSQALAAVPTALGAAFLVPPTTLTALQRKDNTRLVASTQVHAFDGEKSTAHIGQRVPVQTATVAPYGSVSTGDNNNNNNGVTTQGLFGGNGYPVIQYEKTGLTLEFTPQVFPDLDVQVKMSIKSNDVTQQQGTAALTPTFTERNIEGTARIQNNRTMMIASVAQNSQSRGRQGLPVLGLVPVLGRLFSAPRREDSQTDIVIAVTPHVMRAPSVTPRDEEMYPSGTLQTPTSDTLEAMLLEVEREEQLATARSIPTHRDIELPDVATEQASVKAEQSPERVAETARVVEQPTANVEQTAAETATYIPAPKALMNTVSEETTARPATREASYIPPSNEKQPETQTSKAITEQYATPTRAESPNAAGSNSLFSLQPNAAAETTSPTPTIENARTRARVVNPPRSPADFPVSYITERPLADRSGVAATSAAAFRLMSDPQAMRVGERRQIKLLLKTDAPLGLVALTLRLDTRALAVRAVGAGTLFKPTDARLTNTLTPEGLLLVTVASQDAALPVSGAGVLLTLEVEALGDCAEPLKFDADDVHVVATDGRKVLVKVMTDSHKT
jgi:general secretion pathway protein D